MTDDELVEGFESCSLPEGSFHHPDHVRLTHIYLQRLPTLEVLGKLSEGLAALARARGKPERYHQTITWASVFLIQERMLRSRRQQTWQQFVKQNADLLDWKNSVLQRYYYNATLNSPLARETFVMPDRVPD
jgi:hypothetical protein